MIVNRAGIRYEQGWQSNRTELSDRERARAADNQVCPGIGVCHVFYELDEVDVDFMLGVGSTRAIDSAFAALMSDQWPLTRCQLRQCAWYR